MFGSAEETDLESAIYRGVDDGTIRTAADLNALTLTVFARYDPGVRIGSRHGALLGARPAVLYRSALRRELSLRRIARAASTSAISSATRNGVFARGTWRC